MKGEGRHMSVCDTLYDELLMQIQVYSESGISPSPGRMWFLKM